jgi:hypothetical protein
MEWWMWLSIAFFFAGLIYATTAVFKATGNGDNKADMTKAITTVTLVNLVLVLILGGTGYFYTEQNPTAKQPYMMAMLHLNLLLSITSVSVASLYSVSN